MMALLLINSLICSMYWVCVLYMFVLLFAWNQKRGVHIDNIQALLWDIIQETCNGIFSYFSPWHIGQYPISYEAGKAYHYIHTWHALWNTGMQCFGYYWVWETNIKEALWTLFHDASSYNLNIILRLGLKHPPVQTSLFFHQLLMPVEIRHPARHILTHSESQSLSALSVFHSPVMPRI